MARFLARAAKVADIDLGTGSMRSFADVDADEAELVSAIDRLVTNGIMFGDTATSFDPPSDTLFGPGEPVTRWEMAMFLFGFLDYALDSVLVDNDPSYVDGDDGVGKIEVADYDGDGNGMRVDDYFRDARRETPAHVDDRIGAIYELGVTTGVNNEVGENGVFDPNGLVTRAQMASFIMRALGHTNLRPEGVTAQYVTNADRTIDTQVSVRTAGPDFEPVPDKRVEVFYTHFEQVAFDSDGECVERYVGAYDQTARDACEIDRGDQETDDNGNALFAEGRDVSNVLTIHCTGDPTGGTHTLRIDTPSSTAKFVAWAWQGDLYDEVDSDTDRFEVVAGNAAPKVAPAPTHAVVTGGKAIPKGTILAGTTVATGQEAYHVKMGGVLEYTIQLSRQNPDPATRAKQPYVSALPVPGENYGFTVTELRITQDANPADPPLTASAQDFPFDISAGPDPNVLAVRLPRVFTPDANGQIKVQIRQPDPIRSGANRDDLDVQVQIQVERVQGNELTLVESTNGHSIDATGANGWETGEVTTGTAPNTRTMANSRAIRFSDNDPWAATLKVTPERQLRLLAETTRGFVQVELGNQYGEPFAPPRATVYKTGLTGDNAYTVTVDPSSVGDDATTTAVDESEPVSVAIRQRGKGTHSYTYADNTTNGSTASIETVAIVARLLPLNVHSTVPNIGTGTATATTVDRTANVMVYWASTGQVRREITARAVYVADTSQRLIAVNVSDAPVAYEYGSEDRFVVEGEVVSFRQFEDILDSNLIEVNNANSSELAWDDYRRHGLERRPTTDATWRLDELNNCPVASG